MTTTRAALVGIAAATVGFAAYKLLTRSSANNPFGLPGPKKTHATMGNFPDFAHHGGHIHGYLLWLHKTYGPIASFWWGEIPVVSVGSRDLLRVLAPLTNRPEHFFASYLPFLGPQSIQYAQDEAWNRRRAILDPLLSNRAISRQYDDLSDAAHWALKSIKTLVGQGQPVMLRGLMFGAAFRSFVNFAFGDLYKDEKEVDLLLSVYDVAMTEMTLRGEGQPPDEHREREFQKALTAFADSADRALKARAALRATGDVERNFLDELAASFEQDVVKSDFISFLIAAFHTTGNGVAWAIYFLASRPDYQKKIRDELRDMGCIGDALPSVEQLDACTWLDMVFKETLRCRVIAPWGARGNPDGPVTIAGHTFPAGTSFVTALGASFYDEDLYPEPEQFRPERFAAADGKKAAGFTLPFGIGKRICPGYRLSVVESKLLLAAVAMNYEFTVQGDVEADYKLVSTFKSDVELKVTALS